MHIFKASQPRGQASQNCNCQESTRLRSLSQVSCSLLVLLCQHYAFCHNTLFCPKLCWPMPNDSTRYLSMTYRTWQAHLCCLLLAHSPLAPNCLGLLSALHCSLDCSAFVAHPQCDVRLRPAPVASLEIAELHKFL